MTNQSKGKNGLNEVTLGNNTIQTVKVREEEGINDDKRPKIIDSPKIEVTIFARRYIALLDTGATTSV